MKQFIVKYRGTGKDERGGDDPLCQVLVSADSSVTAIVEARKQRANIHYVVSVTEA